MVENIKKAFGRRLKALRQSRGDTQENLACAVGLDTTSIWRLETGRAWISPEILEVICSRYKVSPGVFFSDGIVKVEPTAEEALEVLYKTVSDFKKISQREFVDPERELEVEKLAEQLRKEIREQLSLENEVQPKSAAKRVGRR